MLIRFPVMAMNLAWIWRLEFLKRMRKMPVSYTHLDVYKRQVYILFHTGMRISEFCGLTLKDIDADTEDLAEFRIDGYIRQTHAPLPLGYGFVTHKMCIRDSAKSMPNS